jgi:hypothetical protein
VIDTIHLPSSQSIQGLPCGQIRVIFALTIFTVLESLNVNTISLHTKVADTIYLPLVPFVQFVPLVQLVPAGHL